MNPTEMLTELFRRAEAAKEPVRVFFEDGSRYDLQVVSMMHAEEGGDIVADVLRDIENPQSEVRPSAAMNFKLGDVARVEAKDECLFTRPAI